jgi:hypothetical protein
MIKFLWTTIIHKWFVFRMGIKFKIPLWRLIIHDWTKFTPAEFPHYARHFYGDGDDGFQRCILHHFNANPHHWQYWILVDTPLEMPESYAREMVADWLAASRAYEGYWPTGESWPWLEANWDRIVLHKETRKLVMDLLDQVLQQGDG